MKIMPELAAVREIAATGDYKVLPVSCEILSDMLTPIEAMRILKNVSSHCYMLESVGGGRRSGAATPSWASTPSWRSPAWAAI